MCSCFSQPRNALTRSNLGQGEVISSSAFSRSAYLAESSGQARRAWSSLASDSTPSLTTDRKGKGRAQLLPTIPAHLSRSESLVRLLRQRHRLVSSRTFHTSSPNHAIPLIPAGIGIFKSTTVLAVATGFARILISFFPIGTIASLRIRRSSQWVNANITKPEISLEAEEFWKMWCEGEQPVQLKKAADAQPFANAVRRDDGGVQAPDGRVAYPIPMPPRFGRRGRGMNNEDEEKALKEKWCGRPSQAAKWFMRSHFFLPPLPSASISFYDALQPQVRDDINSYRRYWLGMRAWKQNLHTWRAIVMVLFGLPFLLLTATYLLGLERVPLTGRWRIILLSPEEEATISSSLEGPNWYKSVLNILTTPEAPAPPILSYADWRWHWVSNVLRRLESGVLAECHGEPLPYGSPIIPVPSAVYPVKPRPRMSWMLHSHLPGSDIPSKPSHLEIGPPYSLLLLEKSEENAFSYGFGGKGAGGVVVYTGLLDSILASGQEVEPEPLTARTGVSGFFSSLFSGLFGPAPAPHPQPTEAQSLRLASVLAHEMGHLILSHHLETLSQQQVLWPSVLGLSMDLTRAFIWPLTWILGPTVNDALANVGKTSADEMADRYGQIGFQWKHEYEADLAGLRILGLAGYDPRAALSYFSDSVATLHEIQPLDQANNSWTNSLFRFWVRSTHPTPEQRGRAIHNELERWQQEAANVASL
ncbi:peptidase family M48-domain-containing protein [Kockovaella imperatae]|uniref:Peptidase family M48-domain-containing protein n=1 Tax=Kockovaella imperatae TaxID=4999 RepID=A0A1Y1UCK3_9TREE|nr:peptidase family M48-domain-containing protein [Kockovaella imperatae]ORX35732.1 peptidase family M48-domain-containing protein [Kockovaella imperatae]